MTNKKFFFIAILIIILLSGYVFFNNISKENYISLKDESISGIKIFEKYEVNSDISIERQKIGEFIYIKLIDNLQIAVDNNGYINRIEVRNYDNNKELFSTAKGITILDSKNDIIQMYGDRYYKRIEQGAKIIGYRDIENKIKLEFWFIEDKIEMIRLDSLSMS